MKLYDKKFYDVKKMQKGAPLWLDSGLVAKVTLCDSIVCSSSGPYVAIETPFYQLERTVID